MDPIRQNLRDAIAARRTSAIALSRTIGRNDAWVQQFLERGTPRRLPDLDRLHLAMALEIDERLLGAREPWVPATAPKQDGRNLIARTLQPKPKRDIMPAAV